MLDVLPQREQRSPEAAEIVLETRGLSASVGGRVLLRSVNLRLHSRQVLGIVGPSGAGKTTLLRCLNRLTDLVPGLVLSGDILLHGRPIHDPGVDVDALRVRVGMIFQQPVIFPGSIAANVLFGVRQTRKLPRREWPERVEQALREAALWEEVRHRLQEPAARLSVGQQQRLCLARALAGEPEILLLDEPTSSLDAVSTAAVEDLILRLRERHAIVLVTHNLRQARHVADALACLCVREQEGQPAGEIVESGLCGELFDRPRSAELVRYLSREPS